jgi:hypothetical protein
VTWERGKQRDQSGLDLRLNSGSVLNRPTERHVFWRFSCVYQGDGKLAPVDAHRERQQVIRR